LSKPTKISSYLSRTLILITVASTLLIGGFMIVQQTLHFNRLIQKNRAEYIDNQKIYIRDIVNNEIIYIRLQNETFKSQINSKVKQNVNQAIYTAEAIYQKYHGTRSDDDIKEMIVAAISSLKFGQEYQEVFISSMNGTGIYYPRKPDFAGRNLWNLKDVNGSYVVQSEIKFLKTNTEGFINYHLIPDRQTNAGASKKITFVKKFDHFGWYFGSKQYLSDYFTEFRDQIAYRLSSVRFRFGGYIFMNQTDGVPLVKDGEVYRGPLNLLTNADSALTHVFRKELDATKWHPEGDFISYDWNKMNENVPSKKYSYVRLFEDYKWIIGAGFYLDELQKNIGLQQAELKKEQKGSIAGVLAILAILLFLETFVIFRFNARYKSDFNRFFNFFFASQTSFEQLEVAELHFQEFKSAAEAANQMIRQREETQMNLIREQKRATESDRLKSAFLANMSHEIRTPMNAILGFSELLQDDTQDPADKAVFVKLIRQNGEMLLSLINDIIDISKIEAGLLTVKPKPLNLDTFLKKLNEYYTSSIMIKKGAAVKFEVLNQTEPETKIVTDETRLRQILDNLIGNAIKFTHEGLIDVEVHDSGDELHFSVSDTGIGIPREQQELIFERFRQAEHGTSHNFGGTGLGLAISKNLIELLGGKIDVRSVPGKGSTFHFFIRKN
jgi:signal transduction histidine kinase